jgi:hypothetical protein
MKRFVRTCQKCGHAQLARQPMTHSDDSWLDLKCDRCKSPALDYGKWIEDNPEPEPMDED